MENTTAAYVAGLIDGEGCITITWHRNRSKSSGKDNPRFLPYITVTNTKMEIINWLLENFGGSFTTAHRTNGWNDCHTWYLCTRDTVRVFLETIEPYVIIKKPQIKMLTAFLDLGNSPGKHDDFLEEDRADIFLSMKELNKRGK